MCELLGMNCNVPTDICFSFQGFAARGGKTNHHQDGFGIAFFEQSGCRIFLDNQPASRSPVADLVLRYPIRSTHVIAHIRKASVGPIAIENCHPFQRELWGRNWVFAHNGDLPHLKHESSDYYRPVGQTDSEIAFCRILESLRQTFGSQRPSLQKLFPVLHRISSEIVGVDGVFNFLMSDGDFYFAYCSTKLTYLVRQAPFQSAHLIDEDVAVDFKNMTSPEDRVAIIATLPLTDNEIWIPFSPGQLIAFRDGVPVLESDVGEFK